MEQIRRLYETKVMADLAHTSFSHMDVYYLAQGRAVKLLNDIGEVHWYERSGISSGNE